MNSWRPNLESQRPPWGHGGSETHPVFKEDHIGVVEGHSGVVELILDSLKLNLLLPRFPR
jgi:hypothetical protein